MLFNSLDDSAREFTRERLKSLQKHGNVLGNTVKEDKTDPSP